MKRKSIRRAKQQKKIIIGGTAFGLLLLLSLALLILSNKIGPVMEQIQGKPKEADKPDKLLEQYYSYLEEGKYEKMYQMLDEESKANISSQDFVSRNQKIYEGIEAQNINVKITNVEESSKEETVVKYDVKMDTLAGEISFSNQTVFKTSEQEEQPYVLVWNDSMIFPELTATDKVRVSTEEAKRGKILDRNGVVLAGEGTASSVGLVPGKMNEDSSKDIEKLSEILGVSAESIQKKLEASWIKSDSFVPIKTVEKLTQLEQMTEEPDENVTRKVERDAALLSIPGVMISDTEVRQYPLGMAGAHLIGYMQKVTAEDLEEHEGEGYNENSMIGRSGIESLYEKELKGQNGYKIVVTDSEGNTKSVLASTIKQDGADIQLTIDADLQQKIYDTFSEDKSCSVAMNPYTGEVLALVSTPSFDNNDFILGMSEALWNSLNEDERQPLYNRFRQKLCPGSSFKPIIAAIGLKTGAIDPQEDYGNAGVRWQKDSSWGDYYVTTLHDYEPVTLENGLIYSDNIYFAKAALKIGKENLQAGLEELGFNEKLPFEISVAQSQYANTDEIVSEIQLADSGYGQGQILVNPIHLAALYTGFANKGDVMKPYILYQEKAQGEVWLESAYLPEQAQLIENAMEQVVQSEHGTGHGAYRESISLAGKTGTAEIKQSKDDETGTELGWFGIFTTNENEENPLLILSMVEDVKGRGGSGYVVEKDSQILDEWYQMKERVVSD